MSTQAPWGFTLFADDLRMEVGGKISLMGIYGAELLFPNDYPQTIVKMVLMVNYYEPLGIFKDDLQLVISLPGKEPAIQTFPRSSLQQGSVPRPKGERDDGSLIFNARIPVVFGPLTFSEDFSMKVRMNCGEHEVKLGQLRFRKSTPQELSALNIH